MNIADVLKYEGDNKTLIWKHPIEDFNNNTQLIVHQSQEAIFFLNGQALDTFGPGRHTLETENIPLITKFLNRLTNDKNPFHCEVYFINKVEQMAIKWGTPETFYFNEDIGGQLVPFKIGARGEMSIRVENSRKLLLKLIGTENGFSQEQLVDYFFGIVVSKVKANIARTMREKQISIFLVDEYLDELSEGLKGVIEEEFLDYGVQLEKFMVISIKRPEGEQNYEQYKRIKFGTIELQNVKLEQDMLNIKAQAEAERVIIESRGQAIKRQQEGYTYQQERSFDVAETVAANDAIGQYSNLGIGLGMITGIGDSLGNKVSMMTAAALNGTQSDVQNNVQSNAQNNVQSDVQNTVAADNETIVCSKCNSVLPKDAAFCFKCGEKVIAKDMCECPECKKIIPKAAFCMYCGHKFDTKRICKQCGNELDNEACFCMKCGTKAE